MSRLQYASPIFAGCLGAVGGALVRLAGNYMGDLRDDRTGIKGQGQGQGETSYARLRAGAVCTFVLAYLFSQVIMWSAHNKALRQLPLLQVTVSNLAANTICSGILGQVLFQEEVSALWACGAGFIVAGTWLILRSQEPSQKREEKQKQKEKEKEK